VSKQSTEPGENVHLLLLKNDAQRILGRGGCFVNIAAGIIDGRLMSTFVEECLKGGSVSMHAGILRCVHATNGVAEFTFNEAGELVQLRLLKKPGDVTLDCNPQLDEPSEQVFDNITYERISDRAVVTGMRHTEIREAPLPALVTIYTLRAQPLTSTLTEDCDLPEVTIPNGTLVQVEDDRGIDPIRHEFRDGKVLAVADADALEAARAIRYSPGPQHGRWYLLASILGLGALGLLIWMRVRTSPSP
jgi:hypothetical protein